MIRNTLPLIALVAAAASPAWAAPVGYISSASGYMLHMSGNTAVTADWRGQSPIQGFTGYGLIQMNGKCLTGRNGNAPLTWEGCNNSDKSQRWALSNGRLNNEGGWCADVEGNRGGAGVRVLAWKCNSGAPNQQWRGHHLQSGQAAANKISNAAAKQEFLRNVQSAQPGTVISMSTGRIVAAGAGNIVAAGGGNIVAAGGGNIVAAGGGN